MLAVGEVVAGRYVVEALVAVGGMATVYRVRHMDLGTVHALKMLLHQANSMSERLLLEGQIQARIGHPNVVSVTDVLRVDGRMGLLMEFIDGQSLLHLCTTQGAISAAEVLRMMSPVLDCVYTAHQVGILHRDLKPANIMLRTIGPYLEPLVMDFGIARVRSEEFKAEHTADGVVMGSPGYMAPEQFLDPNDVDVRTDIFSLSAILYEMLAGEPAFKGKDGNLLLSSTHIETVIPLKEVAPSLPDVICDAVMKGLEKEPDDRYADIPSFIAALYPDHPPLNLVTQTGSGSYTLGGGQPSNVSSTLGLGEMGGQGDKAGPTIGLPTAFGETSDVHPIVSPAETIVPSRTAKMAPVLLGGMSFLLVVLIGILGVSVVGFLMIKGVEIESVALPAEPSQLPSSVEGQKQTVSSSKDVEPSIPPETTEVEAVATAPSKRPVSKRPVTKRVETKGLDAIVATPSTDGGEGIKPTPETLQGVPAPVTVQSVASSVGKEDGVESKEAPSLPIWAKGRQTLKGQIYRQAFTLSFDPIVGGTFSGEGTFAVGAGSRIVQFTGEYFPLTSEIEFNEKDGSLMLEGTWKRDGVRGNYRRGKGKMMDLTLMK